MGKKDSVCSVERLIELLKAFPFERTSLSLAQICRIVDMPKTTVYRLLTTLEDGGLLTVDTETGHHHLGYELIKLGAIAQESNRVVCLAHDEMKWISEKTGATCNRYIQDGYENL